MPYLLFTDGGARGNPGIAGAGAVLCDSEGNILERAKKKLGTCTNNQAEYQALILGLETAIAKSVSEIIVFMDSELIVEQMKGNYKVKNAGLKEFFGKAKELTISFDKFEFKHIPREKNKLADKLANEAMDAQSFC